MKIPVDKSDRAFRRYQEVPFGPFRFGLNRKGGRDAAAAALCSRGCGSINRHRPAIVDQGPAPLGFEAKTNFQSIENAFIYRPRAAVEMARRRRKELRISPHQRPEARRPRTVAK